MMLVNEIVLGVLVTVTSSLSLSSVVLAIRSFANWLTIIVVWHRNKPGRTLNLVLYFYPVVMPVMMPLLCGAPHRSPTGGIVCPSFAYLMREREIHEFLILSS